MFCGHELAQLGHESIIIEKADFVGGLAATHLIDGNKFEIGPHIIYTEDEYILDIAKEFLGDDLLLKQWHVEQLIENQLLVFPNSILDMVNKLGIAKLVSFLASYLQHRFTPVTDFNSFLYKKLGREFAEFNVINYTEKMWGVSLNDLETSWIKPRFERLSLLKILKTVYSNNDRSFYYPSGGAGMLYDNMSKNLNIQLKEWPIKIYHDNNMVTSIETNKSKYIIDQIYSSIPVNHLLGLMDPLPPVDVLRAGKSLIHRSQIYVIMLTDKSKVISSQWIYFPETSIPFCRVHAPGNFSGSMSVEDQSVLVFEYFSFTKDSIWSQSDELIISETKRTFQNLNIAPKFEIVNSRVIRNEFAYPLMNVERSKRFALIKEYFSSFSNVNLIGRHGLHTYDNQDGAGRTGIDAARASITY